MDDWLKLRMRFYVGSMKDQNERTSKQNSQKSTLVENAAEGPGAQNRNARSGAPGKQRTASPAPARHGRGGGSHGPADRPDRRPIAPLHQRPRWLKKNPDELDLVFFDLETTGGNPSNSMIIEIAAIKHSQGREVARFETLVNPKRRIPRIVQEITGISQDMVRAAPVIEEVMGDFLNFIGDSVLVAHGAICDVAFIKHGAREYVDKPFHNYYLCTHLMVTNLLPDLPSKTLSGVAKIFGVEVIDAHRAMADAELTRDVFLGLVGYGKSHGFLAIEDYLKIQGDNETLRRLGPGITSQEIETVPTSPGVLYLFNSQGEISYLSASTNLRKSLATITELTDEREFNRLIVDISDYKFERTNHFLGALLSEARDLTKFELALDPRRLESRSRGFVQILLPQDLLSFVNENPLNTGLEVFGNRGRVSETVREFESLYVEPQALPPPRDRHRQSQSLGQNDLEDFLESDDDFESGEVPVRKTRLAYPSLSTGKFSSDRSSLGGNSRHKGGSGGSRTNQGRANVPALFGLLTHGVGWVFGPYEQPKVVQREFERLFEIFPFHDPRMGFNRRLLQLRLLIGHLHDKLGEEVAALQRQRRTARYLFAPAFRKTLNDTLDRISLLETLEIPRGPHLTCQSGLAIVSNTDAKELDVAIVVRSRIREVVRLAVEDSDKLQSKRFFTRLFCKYNDELMHDTAPVLFTDAVCAEIELFQHWKKFRTMEGDWVSFDDLSPLYDLSLI
jgi:DNA polymerase III epsilon subunit family exonuclease